MLLFFFLVFFSSHFHVFHIGYGQIFYPKFLSLLLLAHLIILAGASKIKKLFLLLVVSQFALCLSDFLTKGPLFSRCSSPFQLIKFRVRINYLFISNCRVYLAFHAIYLRISLIISFSVGLFPL